ncbi:MAG: sensor histidine kinase [Spirochaetota bacterium]
MDSQRGSSYEPGLIMIFRLFCGAVAAVFYIFSAYPPSFFPTAVDSRVWFFIGLAYTVVAIYLIVPVFQRMFGRIFLPSAIIATIVIPVISLSWQPYILEGSYSELLLSSTYSISILLIFPLIITAWQYNFRVVILFFVLLGGIDPLIYLLVGLHPEQSIAASLYSSLVRIVSFVSIGFVITELMTNQRTKQSELEQANKRLRQQADYARELTVTRERNRIAHELHDVLAHTLSSLAVQLEAAKTTAPQDEEKTQQLLDKALANARDGLRETRNTVKNLRAEPLEELGFEQALEQLCREAHSRGGFSVHVHGESASEALGNRQEHGLYRIVQEALENCIRHAEAETVNVYLTRTEKNWIRVAIVDDGVGFDVSGGDQSKQFGLSTMKERAASLQGTCRIDSAPGKGTTVTASIPRQEEVEYT